MRFPRICRTYEGQWPQSSFLIRIHNIHRKQKHLQHKAKYLYNSLLAGAAGHFYPQKHLDTEIWVHFVSVLTTSPLCARVTAAARSVSPEVVQTLLQICICVGKGGLGLGFLSSSHRQAPPGAWEIWNRIDKTPFTVTLKHLPDPQTSWASETFLTWQFIGQIQAKFIQHLWHNGVTAEETENNVNYYYLW